MSKQQKNILTIQNDYVEREDLNTKSEEDNRVRTAKSKASKKNMNLS